jgi:hypothetical protein
VDALRNCPFIFVLLAYMYVRLLACGGCREGVIQKRGKRNTNTHGQSIPHLRVRALRMDCTTDAARVLGEEEGSARFDHDSHLICGNGRVSQSMSFIWRGEGVILNMRYVTSLLALKEE